MRLTNFCIPFQWSPLLHLRCDWQKETGEDFDILSGFLLPTNNLATTHPGIADSYWQELKVRTKPDGRVFGVHARSRKRFELAREDIIYYKFDLRRFRREMCEGFGLIPQSGEIDLYDRDIPWATWEPEKGARFPVSLFLGWHGRLFSDRLAEVALKREAAGEIIITANRRYWKEEALDIAKRHNLLLVPLDEIVQVEDGKILPAPGWNEYLTAFCKMVECDLPSALMQKAPVPAPYEFRRSGQAWIVRFEGREQLLKDGKGPRYISLLLSKPGEQIFAADLRAIVAGKDPAKTPAASSAGTATDREALAEIGKKFRALQADLEQARAEGDMLVEQEVLEEMQKLEDYARKATDGRGKLRALDDDSDNHRQAVFRAIDRTIGEIEKGIPSCAAHLRSGIRTGTTIYYESSGEISWVL